MFYIVSLFLLPSDSFFIFFFFCFFLLFYFSFNCNLFIYLFFADCHTGLQHGEVALYEHSNFGGKKYIINAHQHSLGEVGLNDKISSLQLGPHTKVFTPSPPYFFFLPSIFFLLSLLFLSFSNLGEKYIINAHQHSLGEVGLNDKISSVQLVPILRYSPSLFPPFFLSSLLSLVSSFSPLFFLHTNTVNFW